MPVVAGRLVILSVKLECYIALASYGFCFILENMFISDNMKVFFFMQAGVCIPFSEIEKKFPIKFHSCSISEYFRLTES